MFRNVTLQCLTEIAGVSIPTTNQDNYDKQFLALFLNTMVQLRQVRVCYCLGAVLMYITDKSLPYLVPD